MNITNQAILWYALCYKGDWKKIEKAIKEKEPYKIKKIPYSYVTIVDAEYPTCFKSLQYPPWILFYCGNLNLLEQECISIVGSRQCSQEAIENTKIVVDQLKKKYIIVSGLAKGIDAAAHWNSLDTGTIGIIGCGIDQIYPKENKRLYETMKRNYLILSEYPMGVAPLRHHFPWRNRLIAAAGKALIVIQATYKSGTMLTVDACLELSKTVYCLPSKFNDQKYPGCNYLISNGAQIIIDKKDLDTI